MASPETSFSLQFCGRRDEQDVPAVDESMFNKSTNNGDSNEKSDQLSTNLWSQHKQAEVDLLQKDLTEIKEQLIKASVRAHVLAVDLVTQFNPHIVEKSNSTPEECKTCATSIEQEWHQCAEQIEQEYENCLAEVAKLKETSKDSGSSEIADDRGIPEIPL